MYYAIVFKMKDGHPVSSRMLRFPASWDRWEVIAHCRFMYGKDASITVRRRVSRASQ